MSDLKKYINKRKAVDAAFAHNYDKGYGEFKISEMLKRARIDAYTRRFSHKTQY